MTPRCFTRLHQAHPDLQKVILRADEIYDGEFIVTETIRTVERQKQLVAKGASKTMKSRHLTGHAVDLAVMIDGEVRWDWSLYRDLAKVVKQAAADVGIPIEAGADWKRFPDGPHYQLPWADYPI
jgi:peptidoglycan L-alanyl-D-glutamate endopeptidase CwlK